MKVNICDKAFEECIKKTKLMEISPRRSPEEPVYLVDGEDELEKFVRKLSTESNWNFEHKPVDGAVDRQVIKK